MIDFKQKDMNIKKASLNRRGVVNKIMFLYSLLGILGTACSQNISPSNKLSYDKARTELLRQNQAFSADVKTVLSEKEKILNTKLEALRIQTAEKQHLPLYNSTFNQLKPFIESSELFELLKSMPKGGLLHIHSGGTTDALWLINTVSKYPESYVFDQPDNGTFLFCQLAFFDKNNVPEGFVNLQEKLSKTPDFTQQIHERLLLKRPTLSEKIDYWIEFEKRFQRIGMLLNYRPFFKEYYKKAFEDLLKDNIQHIEIRFIFDNLFDFKNGKYPLETVITDLIELEKTIHATSPQFSLKLIYTSFKFMTNEQIEKQLETAFQLKQKFPNVIAGFDLVGDEATGRAIDYFKESWLKIDSLSKKYGVAMPLFLHAGESCSLTNKNVVDIPLLNNKRIGHGLNLVYFPQVMKIIKEQDKMVEVSPISNQILGYVSDLRNHPARVLLANGIQCSINSDDPGVYGYNGLSYDFWVATINWELDLKALKNLVFNAIKYASLNPTEKKTAMEYLEKDWEIFVEKANQKWK